jgi:mono/diheme cytochrome c family protein
MNVLTRLNLIGLFVAASLLAGCVSFAGDITPPPNFDAARFELQPAVIEGAAPAQPPDVANGAVIYADKCASCHGVQGLGDGPLANELPVPVASIGTANLAATSSPLAWYSMVTNGNLDNFMPPFASLSDQQRWDVVAYVYTLSGTPGLASAGEALFAQDCAACHSADLADAQRMVLLSDADIAATILNGQGDMPGFSHYNEADLAGVIQYVRAASFSPGGEIAEGDETDASGDAPEAAEHSVTVTGRLTHGTGEALGDDLEVTLLGYDLQDEALSVSTRVAADGGFRFEDVAWADERIYFVTIEYQGMTFASDFGVSDASATEFDLPLTIYETTTSTENLFVERLHIFFEFNQPDVVQVVMLYLIRNDGDTAVVSRGDNLPTLNYPLPQGAANPVFEEQTTPGRFVQTEDGFGDMIAILPNSADYQLLYAYELPYARGLDFAQPIELDVGGIGIFVPADSIRLLDTDVKAVGAEPFGGVSYDLYEMGSVSAGDALTLTLTGRHPGGHTSGGFSLGSRSGLFIGGLTLIVASAGAWYLLRADELTPRSQDELLDALIDLDDAYAAGEMVESDYVRQRALLKDELRGKAGTG